MEFIFGIIVAIVVLCNLKHIIGKKLFYRMKYGAISSATARHCSIEMNMLAIQFEDRGDQFMAERAKYRAKELAEYAQILVFGKVL
ncbi:hypothetical protein KMC60_gp06 [Achromobacter phage vB_AxyP_19-32_Axy11]|uniref:Uncharacterized protein n=2 Tax=Pourcelvirus Axy11 TaxID=2843622 RepID=A0A514CW30_9CAUD|nr:hypothetical protein KMC60_gp06 [Achromobacter phage vB_AxyP_19-32_Axy11]QDH84060.1 hypothetical protein Axy11_006 [Achromobacter phage vB_AxyP_19-32_Axy11]QDH84652.1 hypothetical protein Axy22_005 [Achromobacter phage vB_AxyP_19-32_Axy22]